MLKTGSDVLLQEMKQQRVKLMKQIKADGEEFRKFKQQKDKEVIQLKAKERKRMVEMNRLKGQYQMQQTVLKVEAQADGGQWVTSLTRDVVAYEPGWGRAR